MALGNTAPPNLPYGPKTSWVDRINVSISLRKYIKLITRRWGVLTLCCFVGLGAAIYQAKTTPDVFEAYSLLGTEFKVEFPEGNAELAIVEVYGTYFADQIQYMNSEPVLGRVYQEMGEAKLEPARLFSHSAARGEGSTLRMAVRASSFPYAKLFAEK